MEASGKSIEWILNFVDLDDLRDIVDLTEGSSGECECETIVSAVEGSDNCDTVVRSPSSEGMACNCTSVTSDKSGSINCI